MTSFHDALALLRDLSTPLAVDDPRRSDDPATRFVAAALLAGSEPARVREAIHALQEAGVLQVRALAKLPRDELTVLVKPAGRATILAARLSQLARWFHAQGDNPFESAAALRPDERRETLAALPGVGLATVDLLELLVFDQPRFPLETPAARVLMRHGWIENEGDYFMAQGSVEGRLGDDPAEVREAWRVIADVGRSHCRSTPRCETCPLAPWLPEGGLAGEFG